MLLSRVRSSRRPLLLTVVLAGLAGATTLGGGCTTSTSPATGEGDGGGAGDSSAPGADSSMADGSGSVDGGTDSSPVGNVDASTCPTALTHLPAGFSQVVVSAGADAILTGASGARSQQMVLDENDDPMFAYAAEDTDGTWSINFTRWDACAGRFTTPLVVQTMHTGPQPDTSIAYDPSTKEIGIAYVLSSTVNNWSDSFGEVWLATMKPPATTFTNQGLTFGSTDFNGAGSPSIAMAGGNIYVGFWEGPYETNLPYSVSLLLFLSSTTTPSPINDGYPSPSAFDGGPVDASIPTPEAGDDAGAAPPHYFNYQAVPFAGEAYGLPGFAYPLENSASVSVVVDSTGAPAIAGYTAEPSYGKQLLFWRPGMANASLVSAFSVDDGVDLALAFEGTKPRIAGHMTTPTYADAATPVPDTLTFFESNDGLTWSPGVNLPNNDGSQGTAFTSALALDGMGNAAVAADINGGVGNGMACGQNPYVAVSSDEDDGGASWTACGADTNDVHAYSAYSVSASYGASRLKGKLTLSFVSGATNATDAGADQVGILYWQHP